MTSKTNICGGFNQSRYMQSKIASNKNALKLSKQISDILY